MPGQKGSFDKMLSNIRTDEKSPPPQEAQPSPRAKPSEHVAVESGDGDQPVKVKRLRAPYNKSTPSVPFNQSVPIEVANTFYDITRAQDWTVSKTLTQAAKALSEKLSEGK